MSGCNSNQLHPLDMVAGAGFEPTTSGLSLRAALRCPKSRSGLRRSSGFSTAAECRPPFFRRRRRSGSIPNELRSSVS